VQIPAGVSGNSVPVFLTLGGGTYYSSPGTTIAVASAGAGAAASVR
jgi:hypothetical protein